MSKQPTSEPALNKTISLKLSTKDDSRLATEAEYRGLSKSELVREAVAAYLVFDRNEPAVGSVLALSRDLAGCVEAEDDLATNPDHMDGFGS